MTQLFLICKSQEKEVANTTPNPRKKKQLSESTYLLSLNFVNIITLLIRKNNWLVNSIINPLNQILQINCNKL